MQQAGTRGFLGLASQHVACHPHQSQILKHRNNSVKEFWLLSTSAPHIETSDTLAQLVHDLRRAGT